MTFTDQNVHDIIASGKPVVIDFWATWCGPCQRMTPIVEELAEEYKDTVVIGKYNIEEENDLTTQYRIMSIPTILFFKNGEQIRDLRLAGAQPKENLEKQIKKAHRALVAYGALMERHIRTKIRRDIRIFSQLNR